MPPTTLNESVVSEPSFWQQLLEGGPLYLLFHLLFAVSIVLALVVVFRRPALPWMLLVSCMPFIWASAAAHIGFVVHLLVLGGNDTLSIELIRPFVYAVHLFNWGCVISVAFLATSIFLAVIKKKSNTARA